MVVGGHYVTRDFRRRQGGHPRIGVPTGGTFRGWAPAGPRSNRLCSDGATNVASHPVCNGGLPGRLGERQMQFLIYRPPSRSTPSHASALEPGEQDKAPHGPTGAFRPDGDAK